MALRNRELHAKNDDDESANSAHDIAMGTHFMIVVQIRYWYEWYYSSVDASIPQNAICRIS